MTLLILSWASFLALDQLPWFMMMEVGFNPGFIPILITVRASLADRLTGLPTGLLGLGQPKPDWRSFTLAALLFGVPLFTTSFVLGSPRPSYPPSYRWHGSQSAEDSSTSSRGCSCSSC